MSCKNIKLISPKNAHSVTAIGVGSQSFLGDNHLEVAGSILTVGEKQYRDSKHLDPLMVNGIRTGDPRGFNKGRSSKFCVGSRVRETPEEGQGTYRPKRCGNNNNNKNDDSSPKTYNDKNYQASSQKFRQLSLLKSLRHFLEFWPTSTML